jgi:hypothetical protein
MNQLQVNADVLYASATDARDHGQSEEQRAKAVEISDFLSNYGDDLDQQGGSATVDKLSAIVDVLVSGAGPAYQASPLVAGVEAYYHDTKKIDTKNFDDLTKKAELFIGAHYAYFVVGGLLAAGVAVAYMIRSVR